MLLVTVDSPPEGRQPGVKFEISGEDASGIDRVTDYLQRSNFLAGNTNLMASIPPAREEIRKLGYEIKIKFYGTLLGHFANALVFLMQKLYNYNKEVYLRNFKLGVPNE